jgi:hypothetical protein
MTNSDMVQPTRGAWHNTPANGDYPGMTRLVVSPTHRIQAVGTGPAVEAAILRKKEGRDGLGA